ncbi:hypothetical protein M0R72_07095 [Candidatus Pacearchaeota archaeon]|jgi:hypothetical protein|nr:hypothetical protein [Candidatus Pacearchaeota archaeon]
MVSNVDLQNAFDAMRNSKVSLFHAGERELATREALKKAEAAVLLVNAADPKKLGGNEAARNATIRELTFDERKDAEKAEAEKRECQLAFDLACMAVDCLKWQIRNEQAAADCEAQRLGAI